MPIAYQMGLQNRWFAGPTPVSIITQLLNTFMSAVNAQDFNRLSQIVSLNREVLSLSGMRHLYDIFAGNTWKYRSHMHPNPNKITATVIFTDPSTKINNLYWFLFENREGWKIVDLKLMYANYIDFQRFY
ncbi:Nuclear transport factor 2 family protein [Caenorhabditis elegans]|uniref:Nuclear transport factor 2 family protein n=1 Tax=Caenorhabditis elegans TaxID=6239 RepID=Q95ZM7_CAEEL|nr:Nuclear transport factor 2 family protein [Caenorhabditis elegans]CCD64707.1 Nuclear transport factor 2 family protein [Caenorhabditis elegans]|eukprot:NP_494550.1 Uncharacterized protein CELE_C16C8.19 [Caenorhabditis elegans]